MHGLGKGAGPLHASYRTALLFLHGGDTDAYRCLCKRMLSESATGDILNTLRTTTLRPDLLGDWRPLLDLSEKFPAQATWAPVVRGFALVRAGRSQEAVDRFEARADGINAWPARAIAHYRLGQIALAREWLARADRHVREDLAEALAGAGFTESTGEPTWWDDWLLRMLWTREAHELIDGKPWPDATWMRLQRARALARVGDAEKADAELAAAVADCPDDPEVRFARVWVDAHLGRFDRARDEMTRNDWHGPGSDKDWPGVGRAFTAGGRPADATVAFDRVRSALNLNVEAEHLNAVTLNPANVEAWQRLGEVHDAMGRYGEAARDFVQALDQTPGSRDRNSPRSRLLMSLASCTRTYAMLIELRPTEGQLWSTRARYHAVRDEWKQAASDFEHSIGSAPPESEEWFEHACLRLIVGDNEGYRAFVREARLRAGQTKDPLTAFVLARSALMTAVPIVEPGQVTRWAEQAVASDRNAWYLHIQGFDHYRADRFDEAIKRLEESNTLPWGEVGTMQNRLVLAMTHHRLGHEGQASALLEGVHRWFKGVQTARAGGAVIFAATDWLPLQLLRAEAEALILYDSVFPADPFAR
jgi:tetratricopeptide (TPR) repeat protein